MDKKTILYTSSSQQINKLESQHLIIENKEYAIEYLQIFGYSNLIKSYRDPYVICEDGKKVYRSGVTFEQITSLHLLDKNLRSAVFSAMLDLEEHVKACVADVIANSFGTDPTEYLQFNNYRDKRKPKPQFRLSGILRKMNEALLTDKDPIHHYQETYESVPPWILFNSMYFTTMVNYIDLFKPQQHKETATKLYDLDEISLPLEATRKLMMDTLFLCVDYRNISAHGGRIYNHKSDCRLRKEEIFGTDADFEVDGFAKLLFLLRLLKYETPFKRLDKTLQEELTRHCSRYPEDVTYLSQVLNVNIIPRNVVYTSKRSNKFHSNPNCSGITNANTITIEDALQQGYSPCKRCCKK